MKALIRKSMLVGLGTLSVAKKKAQALAKELVEKDVFTQKEAAALVRKLEKEGKRAEAKLKTLYDQKARKTVDQALRQGKKEIARLRKELGKLEKKVPVKKKRKVAKRRRKR